MNQKAVGFYWTLPVPWIDRPFLALPEDVDQAAEQSQTIRYQRDLVRRYAKDEEFELVKEGVFVELEPDRAGKQGRIKTGLDDATPPPLKRLTEFCRDTDATLLYVDFSHEIRQRSHMVMDGWAGRHGIKTQAVSLHHGVTLVDGKPFDAEDHFRAWREKHRVWREGKEDRRARALARAQELEAEGKSRSSIATTLNTEGLRSPTGKAWTGENVRKLTTPGAVPDKSAKPSSA